jgi:hypothetical protein
MLLVNFVDYLFMSTEWNPNYSYIIVFSLGTISNLANEDYETKRTIIYKFMKIGNLA